MDIDLDPHNFTPFTWCLQIAKHIRYTVCKNPEVLLLGFCEDFFTKFFSPLTAEMISAPESQNASNAKDWNQVVNLCKRGEQFSCVDELYSVPTAVEKEASCHSYTHHKVCNRSKTFSPKNRKKRRLGAYPKTTDKIRKFRQKLTQ